jgi:hypothetical protein
MAGVALLHSPSPEQGHLVTLNQCSMRGYGQGVLGLSEYFADTKPTHETYIDVSE